MNRIEERLTALKEEGKKAFITYTTAGLPDYDTTKKLMFAQEKAGIDIMEIGVPFSDPIADGPVIQDASFKAIQNGASLEGTFTMMGEVRKAGLNSPVVFMLYYNTVYHYGVEDFVNKCIENGVDGLIIPDLPFEEQGEIKDVLAKNEKSPILIQLRLNVQAGYYRFHPVKDMSSFREGHQPVQVPLLMHAFLSLCQDLLPQHR